VRLLNLSLAVAVGVAAVTASPLVVSCASTTDDDSSKRPNTIAISQLYSSNDFFLVSMTISPHWKDPDCSFMQVIPWFNWYADYNMWEYIPRKYKSGIDSHFILRYNFPHKVKYRNSLISQR
jgi:hypothetical protein